MLGNQFWSSDVPAKERLWQLKSYTTLDLDGGDLKLDLDFDQPQLDQRWDVVINLGTLEHVWDVHQGYSTAARAVKLGGYFMGHAPCEGFAGHAVNITSKEAIRRFFEFNGFEIIDEWVQARKEGRIHWIIAHKLEHRRDFSKPKQIWQSGRDAGIHG